ncbi:MAG: redoxin domain-containing protein [Bacteroidota bacterium]
MRSTLFIVLYTISIAVFGQVKDFQLKDVQNDKEVSLSQFSESKGVAVIFTSNICPYAVYYEGRITQLVADYKAKGIQFILINSHGEAKESPEEMANKVSTWGLDIPYLSDKDQKVKNAFGARKSPEVFLLKNNGGKFSVFYKGAIDNNPQVASDVKEPYLKQNIEALLTNASPSAGGRPIGCIIKG